MVMKRADVEAFGQTYKNSIVLEDHEDLQNFLNEKKKIPSVHKLLVSMNYHSNLKEVIDDGGKVIVHARNEWSYFHVTPTMNYKINFLNK